MDEVTFDGVRYVKASEVAKRFRYTADYVGQLCRAKKIDARLVGRTWYANPDSILLHKQAKYGKAPTEKVPDTPAKILNAYQTKPERAFFIEPRVDKRLRNNTHTTPDYRSLAVRYEPDDRSLLPVITRKPTIVPKTVQVELTNPKKVRIETSEKPTKLSAEPLPDVALSGSIRVEDVPIVEDTVDAALEQHATPNSRDTIDFKPKNINISPKRDVFKTDNVLIKKSHHSPTSRSSSSPSESVSRSVVNSSKSGGLAIKSLDDASVDPGYFEVEQEYQSNAVRSSSKSSSLFLPLTATLLAVSVVLLIFSTSSTVKVSGGEETAAIAFQFLILVD